MTLMDPQKDLIYVYTREPAKEYFEYVDITSVSVAKKADELSCIISVVHGPPATNNTIFYTFMCDQNNDPEDNCPNYPTEDVDVMYTVICTKGNWTIERATYQFDFWVVGPTEAQFMLTFIQNGFNVTMRIPLTELNFTDVLPWRVKTETFTYPSTFPPTGDFVPDEGLAYLFFVPPKPYLVKPLDGAMIYGENVTLMAVEKTLLAERPDIFVCIFEFSLDGKTWKLIGKDYDPGDGWGTSWSVGELSEGRYYVRATMFTSQGEMGWTAITVFYDPTPPLPNLTKPIFVETVDDMNTLEVYTADENVKYVEFCLMPIANDTRTHGVATLCQTDIFGQKGKNACGPTAAASCLAYWDGKKYGDERPYDGLCDNNDAGLKNMAEGLAKAMGYTGARGVSGDDITNGINKYIEARQLRGWLWANKWTATAKEMVDQFSICQDVIVCFRFAGPDSQWDTNDDIVHCVTLKSMDFEVSPHAIREMEIMDPNCGTTRKLRAEQEIRRGNGFYEFQIGNQWGRINDIITVCECNQTKRQRQSEEMTIQQDSSEWTIIGTDYNKSDGWNIEWNTTQVPDGFYVIGAFVVDEDGNQGMNTTLVYVNNHPSDLNKDGKVNILDLYGVARAFGARHIIDPSHPRYCRFWHDPPCIAPPPMGCPHDPRCDVNRDNMINIIDIYKVAKDFGKTYTP